MHEKFEFLLFKQNLNFYYSNKIWIFIIQTKFGFFIIQTNKIWIFIIQTNEIWIFIIQTNKIWIFII